MNLFELTQKYQNVLEIAEQLDEETLKDTLDSIDDAINVKIENTAYVIKSLESNITVIDEEMKRLSAMKSAQTNNIRNLKEYMQNAMEAVGLEKVEGKLIKVSIQNNPQSVKIENEEALQNYMVEQPKKLDKRSLMEDLKKGIEVEGAELQQKRSIRIK